MSVNNKHMATFLLGAAAAFGAYKYMKLTDEEKEQLATTLKDKAGKLKDTAMDAEDKAMAYFEELKTKGGDALKEHMPGVQDFLNNLFKSGKQDVNAAGNAATDAASSVS